MKKCCISIAASIAMIIGFIWFCRSQLADTSCADSDASLALFIKVKPSDLPAVLKNSVDIESGDNRLNVRNRLLEFNCAQNPEFGESSNEPLASMHWVYVPYDLVPQKARQVSKLYCSAAPYCIITNLTTEKFTQIMNECRFGAAHQLLQFNRVFNPCYVRAQSFLKHQPMFVPAHWFKTPLSYPIIYPKVRDVVYRNPIKP